MCHSAELAFRQWIIKMIFFLRFPEDLKHTWPHSPHSFLSLPELSLCVSVRGIGSISDLQKIRKETEILPSPLKQYSLKHLEVNKCMIMLSRKFTWVPLNILRSKYSCSGRSVCYLHCIFSSFFSFPTVPSLLQQV